MRLTVKNLGVISKAEIDLGKDLILLTGENNTGKTYLAYVVYNLSSPFRLLEDWVVAYSKEVPIYFNDELSIKLDVIRHIEKLASEDLRDIVSTRFAVEPDFFKDLELEFSIGENKMVLRKIKEIEIDETIIEENDDEPSVHLIGKKSKNSFDIAFSIDKNDYPEAADYHIQSVIKKIAQSFLPNTFIISAERNGINLFHKELSVIKNKVFDSLLGNSKSKELLNFVEKRFNKYPKPIKDALETAQNLDAIHKQKSDYAYLADEMEANFMGGKVKMNDDGDIQFKPDNSDKTLEIHLASSSVKSLASLSIYLRHIAKKGDFIIIDEPEANLHPNNQIKIARFLARLVNEGFKVMVSTHSDYIMRELNSLIMLGSGKKKDPETTKGLLKKYKEYHENQFLSHEQVGVYMFRQGKDVETVKVDEAGFEIATIDETVDRLNETSQNIYYELFD